MLLSSLSVVVVLSASSGLDALRHKEQEMKRSALQNATPGIVFRPRLKHSPGMILVLLLQRLKSFAFNFLAYSCLSCVCGGKHKT